MTLNESQQLALDLIDRGFNCFITGSAGTGKSFLLRAIREKYPHIVVTASTGVAALNVGGNTVHSVFLPNLYYSINKIIGLLRITKRIQLIESMEMLAIDEISMLDGRLLDQIDAILKRVKGNDKPFGGVQVIAIGDFFQLPPVPSPDLSSQEKRVVYAFEAKSWIFKTINLKLVERQNDPEFIHLLRHLRQGYKSDNFYTLLKDRHIDNVEKLDNSIIRLFPMTARCDKYNDKKHNEIDSLEFEYKGVSWIPESQNQDEIKQNQKNLKTLIKSSKSKEDLKLKIGNRVMLTFNINTESGLVNGLCGEVIGFTESDEAIEPCWELIRKNIGKENKSDYILAIQGHLEDFKNKNISNYPVVRFDDGRVKTITPVVWRDVRVIDKQEIELAIFCQLPLMHAYAISIHKSQGLTLPDACIYFSGCIQYGQYYVAMSRLTSVNGLYIPPSSKGYKSYNEFFIKADPKVLQFYKSILLHQV